MTLEIHKPELEKMVQEEIASGHFQNIDDLLTQALRALRAKFGNGVHEAPLGNAGNSSNGRGLMEILSSSDPIWKPEDHPDIDDAGDWVRQMRLESDRRLTET